MESEYGVDVSKFAFGWLDLNLVKHAHMLNRLSSLFVTELDVLDDLDEIKICHRYKQGDQITDGVLPPLISEFEKQVPEYKVLKGWKTPAQPGQPGGIGEIEKFDDLPVNA